MGHPLAAGRHGLGTGDPFGISCFCYAPALGTGAPLGFLGGHPVLLLADHPGLFAGLPHRHGAGGALLPVFPGAGPDRPPDGGDQVHPGGVLHHLGADLGALPEPVGGDLLFDGHPHCVSKRAGRHFQHGPKADPDGRRVPGALSPAAAVFVPAPGGPPFSGRPAP